MKSCTRRRLPSGISRMKTNAKTFWSILKTFYSSRKVPISPPILINKVKAYLKFRSEPKPIQQFLSVSMYTFE